MAVQCDRGTPCLRVLELETLQKNLTSETMLTDDEVGTSFVRLPFTNLPTGR